MKKILFLLVVAVIVLSACNFKVSEHNAAKFIPEDATFVEDWGNGWIVFERDGRHFLYRHLIHKGAWIDYAYESVTELSE